ncbi:hypothetical protein PHMEG_00014610 [Phytophthora megakarya]|uniref:PiggyBac transposable element-derived protein domain-containing protein n=1 Tax=Phytophthora megakarya TaxID=4795 RepID=A0A225W3C6_9STRA|nr:hypothetical protein PHMEG_00014610 [Phytophthora megakarya]
MDVHWSTKTRGVIPAGTRGPDRPSLEDCSQVSTLEITFKEGYTLGPVVSLDEGMLPSHSRHNPTRKYLKDKPHKWGSQRVVTCCAVSGYCKRRMKVVDYTVVIPK